MAARSQKQRNAGKVLEQNAADDEGNLFGAVGCGFPGSKLPDMLFGDLFPVTIPEDRFEDDADRDGQTGYAAKACLLQRGKGIELSLFARAGIEFPERIEGIIQIDTLTHSK